DPDRLELELPSRCRPGVSRDPRSGGGDAHRVAGGVGGRAGRAGVPARGEDARPLPAAEPGAGERVAPCVVREHQAVRLPSSGAVTFGYEEDRPVVRELTLELHPGEHVALVGATGAGKSTVAKLLTRQYDPQQGRIELGGVDLRDATFESLYRRIVLLPQEGHLFSGTIAENVRLAHPEATDEEVRRALRRIGALGRFESLPDGLETDVQ